MSRVNLPLLAGLALAGISLTFSATGLVHLFAGAGMAIVVMALAFEAAKVSITLHLVRNFRWTFVTCGLALSLVALTSISSLGIYGYLGKAYNSSSRVQATSTSTSISLLSSEVSALSRDRDRLYRQVEAIPASQGTNRRKMLAQVEPQIRQVTATLTAKRDTLNGYKRTQVGNEADIGELRFAAELFGVQQDDLAKFVITVLAFLLDPLAVLLILASGVKGQRAEMTFANGATLTLVPSEEPETLRGLAVNDLDVPPRFFFDTEMGWEPRKPEEVTFLDSATGMTPPQEIPNVSPALNRVVRRRQRKQAAAAPDLDKVAALHPRSKEES